MKIALQSLASIVFGLGFFALTLFLPAGTWNYWQAWVFIAVFLITTLGPSLYLAIARPDTLRRRLHAGPAAETRPAQRIAVTALFISAGLTFVVSAIDHRFGWSAVPIALVIIGNVLVAVGLLIAQIVVLQNSFAAANIVVEPGQQLTSTGLYGIVRHPMYAGALIMLAGTPLALGSYWGLLMIVPGLTALVFRIRDEESMLVDELAGYREYRQQVRFRVIPGLW